MNLNFARKVWMLAGTVALAVCVGSLLAPKTVHALTAALVQVTNTPSNPVQTTEALGSATTLSVSCDLDGPVCYTVPTGMRAIIDQLDGGCHANTPGGVGLLTLYVGNPIHSRLRRSITFTYPRASMRTPELSYL